MLHVSALVSVMVSALESVVGVNTGQCYRYQHWTVV